MAEEGPDDDDEGADGAGPAQVFLVRHGETTWNRAGRRQGRLDSPLTPDGLAQVAAVARLLAAHPIDAVCSSPLGRAATTASVVAEALGLEVAYLDELVELDQGAFAGLTDAEVERLAPGALERRRADLYRWSFPGGESYEQADRRAAAAVGYLLGLGARRPLVVSHAMIGRLVLKQLLGLDPDVAVTVSGAHGLVRVVDLATRTFADLEA